MGTVTCHTRGCGNARIPIETTTSWEEGGETYYVSSVVCGVCGEPITDVEPPLPGTDPEPEPKG